MNIFKSISAYVGLLLVSNIATAQNSYYSYGSDATWNDVETWTTTESGQAFYNNGNVIPGVLSQGGATTDNVTIIAGKTVVFDLDQDITINKLVVKGTLRIVNAHKLNVRDLSGNGKIEYYDLSSIEAFNDEFAGISAFSTDVNINGITFNGGVEITGGATATINNTVNINGNFTIKSGSTVQFANGAKGKLYVTGDVTIENGAKFTSLGTASSTAISALYVAGNITNNGTIEFASGTKPNASGSNSSLAKKVKLTMYGNANAEFNSTNGTATIYQIECDKAVTAEAFFQGHITALAKTAGCTNYTQLPWIPKSGTMRLGSNIIIESWGANQRVQTDGNAYADDMPMDKGTGTMYIPAGAKLWISGAEITVGDEYCSNYQNYKGNVLIAGELQISSGKLTLSDRSWGIGFVSPMAGESVSNSSSKLIVEGGTIKTPRIVCWDGRAGEYSQTSGTVNIDILPCNRYANSHSDKTFFLGGGSKFVMQGGSLNISKQINSSYKSVNGIWMANDDYTPIESSVSGGTVTLSSNALTGYKIFAPDVKFNNLTIKNSAKVIMAHPDDNSFVTSDLNVLKNLSLSSSASLNCSNYDLYVGGSISIDATSAASNVTTLYLNDKSNCTYNVASTSQKWNNVSITKTSASAKVTISSQPLKLTGALYGKLGDVSGNISFVGTTQQTIEDQVGSFAGANLTINNSKGVKLLSDTEFNSVTFSTNAIFSMGSYGLKVNTDLATSGWGTSRMFTTDNSTSAHGLAVPATSGKILPIGVIVGNGNNSTFYAPVTINYTSQGDYVAVAPVYGNIPDVNGGLNFYWMIESTRADFGENNSTATYTCMVPNNNNISTPDNVLGLNVYSYGETYTYEELVQDNSNILGKIAEIIMGTYSIAGESFTFKSVTSGMFFLGNGLLGTLIRGESQTYESNQSGTWNTETKIWKRDNTTYVGHNIGTGDHVIIKSGHTITIDCTQMTWTEKEGLIFKRDVTKTKWIEAGTIEIEEGAKLIFKLNGNYNNIKNFQISRIIGDGELEYQYVSGYNSNDAYIYRGKSGNGDLNKLYSEFCASEKATFTYNINGCNKNINIYNNSDGSKLLPNYPNLKITTSNNNYKYLIQMSNNVTTFNVNGNLTLDANLDYYGNSPCTDLIIGKSLIVNSGKTLNTTNNNCRIDILGNIINNGTIKLNIATFLVGGITNNGEIEAISNNLFYFKGGAVTGELVKVGGSATAGKTNIQNIVIAKDYATAQVQFDIPVGDSNGNCSVHLLRGALNIATSAKTMNLKDFTSKVSNAGCLDDEEYKAQKGSDITAYYDIPDGAKLQLFKGATVNVSARLRLAGALNIMEASTLNVANGNKGLGYVTETSSMRVGANSTFNVSQISPYETDGTFIMNIDKGGKINISSGERYGNYGAFDIRGGEVHAQQNAVLNISNTATDASTYASLYYAPSTSDWNASSVININANGKFIIEAMKPLSSLTISAATQAELSEYPLTVNNTFTLEGTFNANSNDLTIGGNATFNGLYTTGLNKTTFAGASNQTLKGYDNLKFYNFVKNNAGTLTINCSTNTTNDFTLNGGAISIAKDATVKGNFTAVKETTIDGAGAVVLTNPTSSQSFFCEGTLNNLTVDNTFGITSSTQQAESIKITGTINLINGQFSIGGNKLELMPTSAITTTHADGFGTARMFTTYSSFPDLGIQVNFNSGQTRNLLLPIGNAGKYAPVELVGVKSSNVGSMTISGVDNIHPSVSKYTNYAGDALQYYWAIKSSDLNVSAGSLVFRGTIADAIGYPSDEYRGAYLSTSTGLWNKSNTNIETEGNFFKMTFNIKGGFATYAGDYTAGVKNQLPDQVLTYISVKNGDWSDNSTWYVYDLKNNVVTSTPKTSADSFGGCGIIIADGTTVTMSSTDTRLDLCFVTIQPTGVLDANTSKTNNAGYVRGKGLLIVRSANAMFGGNYDDFLSANGGTIEYSGTSSYTVFINSAFHNNVVFSGSGTRYLRSDIDVTALGNVELKDNVNVELQNGNALRLLGDLNVIGGRFTGNGYISFTNKNEAQTIDGTSDINIAGVQIDNQLGVRSNVSLFTNKLDLKLGVLTFINNDKYVQVDVAGGVTGGGESSYVDGRLRKYINSGSAEKYTIGNLGRYAETFITPSVTGYWEAQYFNSQCTEYPNGSGDDEVESIGNEYWKIKGPNSTATARVTLRWDILSGGFTKQTSIVSYQDGGWKKVSYNGYTGTTSNGSARTAGEVSQVNNGARYYAFGIFQDDLPPYWTGSISDDWNTADNWSNGVVPSKETILSITAAAVRQPIIDNCVAYVKDITIESGATLTLQGAKGNFEVAGKMVNNGSFVINYDVNAMPSFIHTNYEGNDVEVNRSFEQYRIYYTGSAVDNGNIYGMESIDYVQKYDGTAEDGEGAFVNSSVNTFGDKYGNAGIIGMASSKTMTQRGKLHIKGQQTVSLTNKWNWIANPYPYTIDSKTAFTSLSANVDATLWKRELNGSEWVWTTFNIKTGVSVNGDASKIAPFEDVCLKVSNTSKKPTMTWKGNPSTTSTTLKSAEIETDVLRLVVSGNTSSKDEMALVFRAGGQLTAFDGDSEKKLETSTRNQIAAIKGSDVFAIAYYPEASEVYEMEIPIMVYASTNETSVTITAANIFDFYAADEVYLVDHLTNEVIDLRSNSSYECSEVDNIYEGRLAIVLKKSKEQSGEGVVTDVETIETESVSIYSVDNKIVINVPEVAEGCVAKVYDLSGSILVQQAIKGVRTVIEMQSKGLYIVEVINNNESASEKVMIE